MSTDTDIVDDKIIPKIKERLLEGSRPIAQAIIEIKFKKPFLGIFAPHCGYCHSPMVKVGVRYIAASQPQDGKDLSVEHFDDDILAWCQKCDRVWARENGMTSSWPYEELA